MERKFEKAVGAASGAVAAATFGLALRPLFLNWGATDEEVHRFWPGDELSPRPASEATRAITIHAPVEAVWPWIVQIGQDRGGFYSYTWLENLFGARIRNADRILPEHQGRQVGDTVWMAPRERYRGKGCSRVARLEPGRDMVLVTPDDYDSVITKGFAPNGTWAFLLDPVDERTTRLIVRSRSGPKADPFRFLVFDPIHFVMEQKMMRGIRDRAEAEEARRSEARAA
ncbi:MAG TPA: hypothetical protein VLT87_09560 [Thermoanaerobaculia bacterium]|nr:hypothetical protein [Thermoanaerobaculia bacterium]